jgi:Uma2 family endonuclease
LEKFVREYALGEVYVGPVDVLFAEGDYLAPDLVFVRRDRTSILDERGVAGAPDLVIEVLSPKTAARDRTLKRERYAAFGVPEYWVIDAITRRVEIYRGGQSPVIATETFSWQPIPDEPALTLRVADLVG